MTIYVDEPLQIDPRGRTAETLLDDHIYDLIFQVLFTAPGERVNRPEFGCGLQELVFMPASDVIAAATQQLVQGSLHRWLEDLIAIESVEVKAIEASIEVKVVYRRRDTGQRQEQVFARDVPA
jgi:phage baseplate assembly protein W